MEGFVFVEDVKEGQLLETCQIGGGVSDWMIVEDIITTAWGVMFYGMERLSGRKFFTVPVPETSLVTAWNA